MEVRRVAVLLATIHVPALTERPGFPLTNHELKIWSGYYTEKGKYLGGIPTWDNELENNECGAYNNDDSGNGTVSGAASLNATVCTEWTASEASSDEFEKGTCTCQSITAGEYCDGWTCIQREVDNEQTCDSSGENCFFEKETEHTRCGCEAEDDSGHFCAFWTCLETDSDGSQEHEEYTCSRASPSGLYCEAWTGVIEGEEEEEMSSCECAEEWNGGQVCSYWECEERGMDKCTAAGNSWCNLGVSVGVGGTFGFLGVIVLCASVLDGHYDVVFVIASLLWIAGWYVGVVIWGGEDGAMYVGIWWGVFIVGAVICALRK